MPYLLLLIVVVIIGFLVVQQLEKPAPEPESEPVTLSSENTLPLVPTQAQDVEQFGKDMGQFLQNSAKDQLKDVDEMTK